MTKNENLVKQDTKERTLRCDYSFNPFLTNVFILYPLKTTENVWFSDAFRSDKG